MAIRYLSGINVDSNTLFVDSTNNRVGIGTSNPTGKLQIAQSNSGGVAAILLSEDESTIQGPAANTQIRMGGNLVLGGSNIMTFGTNGSERMRVTSDGSLLVGATSQTYNNATYGYVASFKGAVTSQSYISVSLSNQASTSEGMLFGLNSASGDIYVLDNKPLVLYTNATEKMRIAAGGNVLIGTTTDAGYKLRVNGSSYFDAPILCYTGNAYITAITSDGVGSNNGFGYSFLITGANHEIGRVTGIYETSGGGGSGGLGFWTRASGTLSAKMTLNSGGTLTLSNYGSGSKTGTVAYNLAVDASGNIIETAGGVVDGSGTANYVTKWIDANTVGDSQVFDNGTTVGIGVATPQSKLDLNVAPAQATIATLGYSANASLNIRIPNTVGDVGQIVFTNASAPTAGYGSIGVVMTSGSGVGLGDMVFATKSVGTDAASTERMRINSGGNVLIGTTTDAGYKLDVSGAVRGDFFRAQNSTTTGTTILSYSDQFKQVWTTRTSFSFTGAGVYYFNLVFATDQGFTYDLTATTSRDELWRNFGALRDNSYLNVESDGDFETYAVGDVQIISNDMYLDAPPTAFKSATTTASGVNGTSPWAYYIVRYAIYIPNYAGNTSGFFKVHLTTYGYDGNAPLFINA